jgi:hypothetical protein
MWTAASDQDYSDENGGPYPNTVERTCRRCRFLFNQPVTGEYEARPLCPRCEAEDHARWLETRDGH